MVCFRKRKLDRRENGGDAINHSDYHVETHHSDDDDDDDGDNDGRDKTVSAKNDDDYQRPARLDLIGMNGGVVFSVYTKF
jgi:hypothetical protein